MVEITLAAAARARARINRKDNRAQRGVKFRICPRAPARSVRRARGKSCVPRSASFALRALLFVLGRAQININRLPFSARGFSGFFRLCTARESARASMSGMRLFFFVSALPLCASYIICCVFSER